MNKNIWVGIGLIVVLIILGSQGFALSFFSDANIERKDAQAWIDQNEEKIVTYLLKTDFPKPTEESREVYELKVDGESKLKGEVNWTEKDIELMDLDSEDEADLTVKMNNGTYQKAIEKFIRAVEQGEELSGSWFYAEAAMTTGVEAEGNNGLQNMRYKYELLGWMNDAKADI